MIIDLIILFYYKNEREIQNYNVVKGKLFNYTSDYLKSLGYGVVCLDYKNPNKSTRYNLLQPVIDAVNNGD